MPRQDEMVFILSRIARLGSVIKEPSRPDMVPRMLASPERCGLGPCVIAEQVNDGEMVVYSMLTMFSSENMLMHNYIPP